MITLKSKLTHGLQIGEQTHYEYMLRPITLAQELSVLDEIDAQELASSERHAEVLQNLAYIAQMIEFKGVARESVTAECLLQNLTSADYNQILDAIKDLNTKPFAAGQADPQPAPAVPNAPATP